VIRQNSIGGLVLIVDQDLLRVTPDEAMMLALSVGVRSFQYRNKQGTRKKIYETSLQLARLAREVGAQFIVNDHVDIAAAVDADGVHLGQDDLPIECARKLLDNEKIIGISTHSIEQAQAAQAAGADYIGFGSVFGTSTKVVDFIQGIDTLAMIKKRVSIPVIAIGGINHANIRDVMQTGTDGAAVISAVLSAADIKLAAGEMLRIIQDTGAESHKSGGMR
jgi:thiamine-phosphate diphosphorylase